MASVIFKLPIQHAYDLQLLLNSSDNVRHRICNAGIEHFEKMWKSLDSGQKVQLLRDIRDINGIVWELRSAAVVAEAEIGD